MILQTGHPPQGSKYVTFFCNDKVFSILLYLKVFAIRCSFPITFYCGPFLGIFEIIVVHKKMYVESGQ